MPWVSDLPTASTTKSANRGRRTFQESDQNSLMDFQKHGTERQSHEANNDLMAIGSLTPHLSRATPRQPRRIDRCIILSDHGRQTEGSHDRTSRGTHTEAKSASMSRATLFQV